MDIKVGEVVEAVIEATKQVFDEFEQKSNLKLQKVTVELLTEVTFETNVGYEYKLLDALKLGGNIDLSKVDLSTLKLELTRKKMEAQFNLKPREALKVGVEEGVKGIKSALAALATNHTYHFRLDAATIDLKFTVKRGADNNFLVVGTSGSEVKTHHLILEVAENKEVKAVLA